MNSQRLGGKVTPKKPNEITFSEKDIINSLESDEQRKAQIRLTNAAAADQEKLTELKESYAGAVLFFMWVWFGALCLFVISYSAYQMYSGIGIPKEVAISFFTCTAVVVGLVGYILKGLFGSK